MKSSFYRVSILVACLFALPLLPSMAEAAPVKCGCYNLNALWGKLGGRPKAFARYGLFCVIKGQSASYVHTLSYRMVNARQDCGMFMKKLGNTLGKEMKRRKLLLNSKCQPLGTMKLCPVNKSFHVRYKCKCPKGTRFGAVSAAYRMCKTLVPPSCGVNRQFKAGTYCRCPRGTKMARARHHLFRICKK